MTSAENKLSRREFGTAAAVAAASAGILQNAHASGNGAIKVGVIGCGGRGTGAANDALAASPDVRIVALADAFADRLEGCRKGLAEADPARATVDPSRCHVGFDAYRELLAGDVDVVILATSPHFRPIHFAEAVARGKHVFMEKPVAVDPPGIRQVLAAAEAADAKNLSVVAGTQRRHESCYRAAMAKIAAGAIGKVVSARVYWNMGSLWVKEREASFSDIEWQMRNWLYFTWLSGDHIVEQHVHNLDVVHWATGETPTVARGMGGRQVRTDKKFGNIFDHFAIEYEFPSGVHMMSMCRQTDHCWGAVEEVIHGSEGRCVTRSGFAEIQGKNPWRFEAENNNPYVQEHRDLIESIVQRKPVNEARTVAHSTLMAIMGRMSAYTGRDVSWEFALKSNWKLGPAKYEFGPFDPGPVATPGRTPLI
jgi:predicted dehydrogenase